MTERIEHAANVLNEHVAGLERIAIQVLPRHRGGLRRITDDTTTLVAIEHADRLADLDQGARQVVVGRDEIGEDVVLTAEVENLVLVLGEAEVRLPRERLVRAALDDVSVETKLDALVLDRAAIRESALEAGLERKADLQQQVRRSLRVVVRRE